MEAKDTVMSQREIDIVDERGVVGGDIVPYLNWQAEISFKAGEQESDKKWRQILSDSVAMAKLTARWEVVEWMQLEGHTADDVEAKLKEWGL